MSASTPLTPLTVDLEPCLDAGSRPRSTAAADPPGTPDWIDKDRRSMGSGGRRAILGR